MLSTPPTNTPKIPPVDQTRRHFLTVAAGGAATLAIPATAKATGSPTDPIYPAIEAHRNAHVAHMASLEEQNRLEQKYGAGQGSWVSEKPCRDEDGAFMAFVAEPATTARGLFAKLAYLDQLAGDFETEWMVHERVEAAVLIRSFAATLKNIGVQP